LGKKTVLSVREVISKVFPAKEDAGGARRGDSVPAMAQVFAAIVLQGNTAVRVGFSENKIVSCVSKGPTAVNRACPTPVHVYYAVQASMAPVRVPTPAILAASVQAASGQVSGEHRRILLASTVPQAHGAPHLLQQLSSIARNVGLADGVLLLVPMSQAFASHVLQAGGVTQLVPVHFKHALTVLLANGATAQVLLHWTHVEHACQADGVQLLERTPKIVAHPAVVV